MPAAAAPLPIHATTPSGYDRFEAEQQAWLETVTVNLPKKWEADALSRHAEIRAHNGVRAANLWIHDHVWLETLTRTWPHRWKIDALRRHSTIEARSGTMAANTWISDIAAKISACRIAPNTTNADILDLAEKLAKRASARAQRWEPQGSEKMLQQVGCICTEWGIDPPAAHIDNAGALARMEDALWWRRKLRREVTRGRENIAIALGYVHKHRDIYISCESLEAERQKERRNANILKNMEAISEDGEIFSIAELAEHSLSNPALRRGELMVRVKGYEDISGELLHVGIMVTLTCPSRMHARFAASGAENPVFDGTTPRQAQNYLCDLFSRIRSKLRHEGTGIYGLRIVEPHHDATPHWHLLLFMAMSDRAKVETIFRDYALRDSPDEPGAKERRIKFEHIDPAKGGAAAYVAKYIGKNIDGTGIILDENGVLANESASRVTAWARLHGIRQFQFIGGPPVGLWREFRRIPECNIIDAPENIQLAHAAAQKTEERQADYAGLIRAVGGPLVKRAEQMIQLSVEVGQRAGRYGWQTITKAVGVFHPEKPKRRYESERKQWTLRMRTGEFGRCFAGDPAAAHRPWTRVNNCAGRENRASHGDRCKSLGGNVIEFPRAVVGHTTGPPMNTDSRLMPA